MAQVWLKMVNEPLKSMSINKLNPVARWLTQMHKRGMKNEYFLQLIESFAEWLTRLNYADQTIRSRKRHLQYFLEWIENREIQSLSNLIRLDLEQYNQHLHNRPIKAKTIEAYLSVLKLLNDYLESYGEAPVVKVKLTVEKELKVERTILTKVEINKLYEACENTIWGMRDKVILAIFYGCGLRSREGRYLELGDIDFSDGLLHIKKGKNYKERYVPMSNGVSKELQNWIAYGHPIYGAKSNLLLPNTRGKITNGNSLNKRIKLLCSTAEIDKYITLHCLRHSIATHLLQSGMDLENIAQFLGHKGMEATKIYTRIVNDLNEEI